MKIVNVDVVGLQSFQTPLDGFHHVLAAVPAAVRISVIGFGEGVFGCDHKMIAVRFEEIAEEFLSSPIRVIDRCVNEVATFFGK